MDDKPLRNFSSTGPFIADPTVFKRRVLSGQGSREKEEEISLPDILLWGRKGRREKGMQGT
jgi:hypothetical protein